MASVPHSVTRATDVATSRSSLSRTSLTAQMADAPQIE
jgi:hypothetical protein